MKPRIGVLTSGGDCPGLNAVLRAPTRCTEFLRDVDICSVIDFCHVERSETSLALSLNIVHGNDLRFFASLRMTEEDPWKSFAYSGTPGKSVTFVPV